MSQPLPSGVVTGVGSVPGSDPREAAARVVDELPGLPHVPELPDRGPWADPLGRGCAALVDLPTELEAGRWRTAQRVGRDARRARSLLEQDLDAVEEALEGFVGWAKTQICGPLSLGARLELRAGGSAITDPAARSDLSESLAEGVVAHLAELRRRVPGARWVVQLDEPALTEVTSGSIPRPSGWGTVAAVASSDAGHHLAQVVGALHASAAPVVVHCCAEAPDLEAIAASGADGASLDVSRLDLDELGADLERWFHGPSGLWCGVGGDRDGALDDLRELEGVLGVGAGDLARLTVLTPSCGLAGRLPVGVPLYADQMAIHRRLAGQEPRHA